ncbi:MAG: D-2-hydroxyacid dehydrogenase [Anaerolineae bacterium]|nr:D-2-hydroxyacid dehydrogenase [Anaerolineae bacterium]
MEKPPVEVLITIPLAEDLLERLQSVSPRLKINQHITRRAEEISAEVWQRTEVLYTDVVLPDVTLVPNLRWIQFHWAGIEYVLESTLAKKPELTMTTLSGAAAPQMAEFILMMMLALGHRLPDLTVNQAKTEWPRDRWERFVPLELRGSTVGIIGYGSIGRELARLLRPFDVKALAVKRNLMDPYDHGYAIEGLGDPDGDLFTRLYPIQALQSVLKECDFVVVTLPLTAETRDIIGADELAAMKSSAYLIDACRGTVVNEEALLTALQEHKIAGAALDVFADEPLPPASPFWKLPNVFITPHISGISPAYDERAVALFGENIKRYLSGEKLFNKFDPEPGY